MPLNPDNLLKALYETVPNPVFVANKDRTIVAANAAAIAAFGYSEAELIGLSPDQLYASMDTSREIGGKIFPLDRDAERLHRLVNLRRRNGSEFPAELTVSGIFGADGEPLGVVALIRDLTEMRAAQDQRLHAEKVLKMALASISEGFVIFDEADRLFLCNDAYRDMYALSAPALQLGRSFESIVRYGLDRGQYPEAGDTPEAREAWLKSRLQKHTNPGPPVVQQIGDDRWIQVDERITQENYRVGLRTDVSAIRQIKSEHERLGLILEGVAQEVYVINTKTGRFISANKSARDNLQYSLEELRDLTPAAISADLSADELAAQIRPLVAGETKVMEVDTRHLRKDGTAYTCRVKLERMEEEAEPVIFGFAEDVTDRLEIERAMARKAREFETLVQNLPDIVTRSLPDTTLTYLNANYAKFVGREVGEMLGRRFLDFVPENARADVTALIAGLTPENPIATSEQVVVDHAGRQHWYLWSNQMEFENGRPVELVSVGRDITESRAARERIAIQTRELAVRNEALEQFAGIVSHDLKAPLRQIRLFADMIAEDVAAGKTGELTTFSAQISDRSRALERLISSLLEFSHLAYRSINPETFKLSEAISDAWGNLAATVFETKAQLIAETDIKVCADPQLLVQLFQNLFANSMKYRESGTAPVIRVGVETTSTSTVIHVEDNGIGVNPAHADRIFGVFQRLHRDERQYSGSGIGLALCSKIVESHGGAIELDRAYTGGARFRIQLPLATT